MKKIILLSIVGLGLLGACKDNDVTPEDKGSVYVPRPITATSSPYISKVFEFLPGPGQFVNTDGLGTPEAAQKLVGKNGTSAISLGGFGGYVVFGFDHSVVNGNGDDLAVYGNAFEGNSEPGIVMVMQDLNGNGLPDDTWYELAGSEHTNSATIKNYKIVYYNPKKAGTDVQWKDNKGNKGAVLANDYHTTNNYYPTFAKNQDSLVLEGTLLPNNKSINDMGWVILSAYKFGYVDNYSDEYKANRYNSFDISWAVDSKGDKIQLSAIDFVKIYSAMNLDAGWLGEVSTEVAGAANISLLK